MTLTQTAPTPAAAPTIAAADPTPANPPAVQTPASAPAADAPPSLAAVFADMAPAVTETATPPPAPVAPEVDPVDSAKPARNAGRWTKDAFYAKVMQPDNSMLWVDASRRLGKPLPFARPRMTCAMRVYDHAVTFAVQVVTKREASNQKAVMPRGPLERVARNAVMFEEAEAGIIYVQHEDTRYRFALHRSGNGDARVAPLDDDHDTVVFELGRRPSRIECYFRSPAIGRVVAVSWLGHLGAPGKSETVIRALSRLLNGLGDLGSFAQLAQLTSVDVPAKPVELHYKPVIVNDVVDCTIPVDLFTDDTQPVGSGTVHVEFDMNSVDPEMHLLLHLTPDEAIAAAFPKFDTSFRNAVMKELGKAVPEQVLEQTCYDIVLGELGQEARDVLREGAINLPALQLTPTRFRPAA